jgi:hypothetical protein
MYVLFVLPLPVLKPNPGGDPEPGGLKLSVIPDLGPLEEADPAAPEPPEFDLGPNPNADETVADEEGPATNNNGSV